MLWPAVVIALHALALGLLVWAVHGRVPRSGVRCPRCWYDMGAAAALEDGSLRCPECGRGAAASEWARPGEAWRHSKKRWRGVVAAALIEVGCGYYWYQRTPGYESWTGLMPDWALMRMVTAFPDKTEVVSRSLAARWSRGELSRGHVAELSRRFLASPASLGLASPIMRPKWPIGHPVVIRMAKGPGGGMYFQFAGVDGQEFWRQGDDPAVDPPLSAGRGGVGWADERGYFLRLPPATEGTISHSLLVEQQFHYDWQWNAGGVVWSQRFAPSATYQGVATIDECITPIDTPDARDRVRRVLQLAALYSKEEPYSGRIGALRVWVDPNSEDLAGRDYSLACRVTLERDGRVLADLRQAEFDHDHWRLGFWEIELASNSELASLVTEDGCDIDLSGVRVRVQGDGALAIQDLYFDKYWNGEIVVDAMDVLREKAWPLR